jgi:hypothetical protein
MADKSKDNLFLFQFVKMDFMETNVHKIVVTVSMGRFVTVYLANVLMCVKNIGILRSVTV